MPNFNIIEINEMIDMLEDYVNTNRNSAVPFAVGGMAGTMIFRHVIDAVLSAHYKFSEVLIIEGCQDYIGLSKTPYNNNYIYYADLYDDIYDNPIIPYNPWLPEIYNFKPSMHRMLNSSIIDNYNVIIINNAHLIPPDFINDITYNFSGKIISVVDPFDMNGEIFTNVPCITDTLNKVSPIVAMARSSYDVDSRAIDKNIPGRITEVKKINKKSIGKIDDKQYITNDAYLCDIIRSKQLQSPFRKNQKLFVTSNFINININESKRGHSLTKNSMCIIESTAAPLMRLRIYSTKINYYGDVSYSNNPPISKIQVVPANILMIDQSAYHRYNHSALILNDDIGLRERYSILKNSNNLTIARYD